MQVGQTQSVNENLFILDYPFSKKLLKPMIYLSSAKRIKFVFRGSLIMGLMEKQKPICSLYLALQNEQKCSPGLQLQKARQTMINSR